MRNPFRRRTERRDITDVPWDVGGPTSMQINQDKALSLAPVYAAVRHIADNISSLPLDAFRKVDSLRQPMGSLPQLFKLLDDEGDLNDWVFTALTSLALRGNAVGLVTVRDGMQFPVMVAWLPMGEVHVDDENPMRPIWYWKGRRLVTDDVVHIPWFKIPGKTLGLSPIEQYALTISSGIQAQQYGNDWFTAGGVPPGRFKNTAKTIDQKDADEIKARLVTAIRTRRPLVYGADWDYDPYVIPPEQAQFIETMNLTANQVAAIYGLDPTEIGGEAANSQQYANEEHRQTRRMQDLRPWIVRLERKFSSWLPDRQYVRFNVDAVIRTDLKTRHEVYRIDREIGLHNTDELRAFEDLPPLPNGEGKDYTPLAQAAQEALPAAPEQLALPPGNPSDVPSDDPARSNGHKPIWANIN